MFTVFGLATLSLNAQVQAGAAFSGDGLRNFYFAVGNYYQVPEREVDLVRDRALPPDEVPVAFYLAQRARVNPTVVVDLRRRGVSWADIALHFHLHRTFTISVTVLLMGRRMATGRIIRHVTPR